MSVKAGGKCIGFIARLAQAGYGDQPDRQIASLSQLLGNFVAIDSWHGDIENCDLRLMRQNAIDGLLGVKDLSDDGEACPFQEHRQGKGNIGIVVHDDDAKIFAIGWHVVLPTCAWEPILARRIMLAQAYFFELCANSYEHGTMNPEA
jgi:hypothetical protein